LTLEPAPFDLGQELEALVDMFAVQCAKKNVALVLDLDDRLPRNLTGDRARVRQILANLVGNSCKVGRGIVARSHRLFESLCVQTVRNQLG
jgi:signal transduction histidine kinase